MEKIFMIVIIAAAVIAALKIFTLPIRLFFRLAINAVLGFVFLLVVNLAGSFIGISLGMNILNAVIAGTLGIPGIVLLVLLKILIVI